MGLPDKKPEKLCVSPSRDKIQKILLDTTHCPITKSCQITEKFTLSFQS